MTSFYLHCHLISTEYTIKDWTNCVTKYSDCPAHGTYAHTHIDQVSMDNAMPLSSIDNALSSQCVTYTSHILSNLFCCFFYLYLPLGQTVFRYR